MSHKQYFKPYVITERTASKYYYSEKYGLLAKIHQYRRTNEYVSEIALHKDKFNVGHRMVHQFNREGVAKCWHSEGHSNGAIDIWEFNLLEYVEITYFEYILRKIPYILNGKYYDIKNSILNKYYELKYPNEN